MTPEQERAEAAEAAMTMTRAEWRAAYPAEAARRDAEWKSAGSGARPGAAPPASWADRLGEDPVDSVTEWIGTAYALTLWGGFGLFLLLVCWGVLFGH